MKKKIYFLLLLLFPVITYSQKHHLPEDFVYIKDLLPEVILEMRYAGSHNFIGEPIRGYEKARAILTKPAAEALRKAQQEFKSKGYTLKIFDAYRPQQAVNHFIEWARKKEDTLMKQEFYPNLEKSNLFNLGYIASRSGHSRGSTIDLTLVDSRTGKQLDMGGDYDFFGEISHHGSPAITREQQENRNLLKNTMSRYGFRPYSKEWWHFTYQPEPFPDTYFNFIVK